VKDALELLTGKLGIGGGIGFLLGWLIVWWIEPTTKGGMGLLILVSTVLCSTAAGVISKVAGIISKWLEGKDTGEPKGGVTEMPKQGGVSHPEKAAPPSDQWQC
jgi:hypothetical protein